MSKLTFDTQWRPNHHTAVYSGIAYKDGQPIAKAISSQGADQFLSPVNERTVMAVDGDKLSGLSIYSKFDKIKSIATLNDGKKEGPEFIVDNKGKLSEIVFYENNIAVKNITPQDTLFGKYNIEFQKIKYQASKLMDIGDKIIAKAKQKEKSEQKKINPSLSIAKKIKDMFITKN